MNGVLLVLGLALTSATQIRVPGFPVGLGEGLLLVWAGVSWVDIVGKKDIRILPNLRPFVYFSFFLVLMILISTLYKMYRATAITYDTVSYDTLHDIAALLFSASLIFTFAFLRPAPEFYIRVLRSLVLVTALGLGGLLLLSQQVSHVGPFSLVYGGTRFLGLSVNPNQLGLTIVPVPFLCGYFLLWGSSGFSRPALAAGLALSVWVGLASGSDAVQVAWISGLGLLVITAALLRLQRVMLRRAGPTLSQTLTTWNLLTLGVLSLVALSAIPWGQNLIDEVRSGDEGGIREFLWKNAWRALWNSPLVGVGPGQPELGDRTQQIISEAHNLFLDIGLATGFLGLGALIVMLLVVLFRSQLLEQPVLLAAFVSLLGFSFFHHTARHPLFWFYLILISSVAYTRRRSRDAGAPVMTLESGRRPQTEKLRSPVGRGVAQLDRMRS